LKPLIKIPQFNSRYAKQYMIQGQQEVEFVISSIPVLATEE
jgi:hypothetical protein